MSKRFVVEGTWSGYSSSQSRVVHRMIVSEKTAAQIEELGSIQYTDGTSLFLSVRPAKPRERIQKIDGYSSLISSCLSLGVRRVADITAARESKRLARIAAAHEIVGG